MILIFLFLLSALKMPLFKILDITRTKKGLIRATTLQEVISQATEKLNLDDNIEYKVCKLLICFNSLQIFVSYNISSKVNFILLKLYFINVFY